MAAKKECFRSNVFVLATKVKKTPHSAPETDQNEPNV